MCIKKRRNKVKNLYNLCIVGELRCCEWSRCMVPSFPNEQEERIKRMLRKIAITFCKNGFLRRGSTNWSVRLKYRTSIYQRFLSGNFGNGEHILI